MPIDERALEALLEESRTFEPSEEFRREAVANDPDIYERAAADPEAFWAGWAEKLDWFEHSGTACWNGTRPTHSGSWAGS